jgi:hypothetical protein
MSKDRTTVTVRGQERAPVDSVADRVTRPGFEFISGRGVSGAELGRDAPVMREPPLGVEDLRGQSSGRMTIIGYMEGRAPKPSDAGRGGLRKHRWAARCHCGRYEVRRGRTWRRIMREGAEDMCLECRRWKEMNTDKQGGR